jgi:ankyrin repeat protein
MTKKSFTNIFEAAWRGTVEDVKYFIEQQGADIYAEDADGWTPLDIAKGKGNEEVIRYSLCFQ